MKHINSYKNFKLFESISEPLGEEIEYLYDIFQELTDGGRFAITCADENTRHRYVEKESIKCQIATYKNKDRRMVRN